MKRLGDAELEIMLAVWSVEGPVTSVYVHEKLRGSRDWALPAVITSIWQQLQGIAGCPLRRGEHRER